MSQTKQYGYGNLTYIIHKNGEIHSPSRTSVYFSTRYQKPVTQVTKPRKLKLDMKVCSNGYSMPRLHLYDGDGGRAAFYVARLIWCVFNDVDYFDFPKGKYIHHHDNDPKNCHLDNLYIGDHYKVSEL